MPERRIFVIGHSHVNCIAAAAREMGAQASLRVLNLRALGSAKPTLEAIVAAADGFRPAALCLCLGGNFHNAIGLLEHPEPFAVGALCPGRQTIPRALLKACFAQKGHGDLMGQLFAAFSNATRYVMAAPPPMRGFDHVRAHPGVFADRLDQGPAPEALRLELYALQNAAMAELAANAGATIVMPPAHVFDDRGFLARRFAANDPTHGNVQYGRAMIAQLRTERGLVA